MLGGAVADLERRAGPVVVWGRKEPVPRAAMQTSAFAHIKAVRLKTDLGVFLQIFFCSICKMGMWVGLQKKPGLREGFVACKELVGWRHRFFCMAAAAKPRGAARSAAEGEPLMPKGYDGH